MADDPIELFASARPDVRTHNATELEAVWTAATMPAVVDEVPLVESTVVHPEHRRRRTVALAVAAALVLVTGMVLTNRSPRFSERGTGDTSVSLATDIEQITTTSAAGRPFVPPDCTVERGVQEPMPAADRIASQLLRVGESLYRGIGPVLPVSAAHGVVGSVCRTDQGGQLADGDAPYAPGTPLLAVEGYGPHFRLGVIVGDRLDVYELVHDPTARTGADLLDLSVGVDAVELRDLDGGDALLDTWTDGRVAALVAGMTTAPVDRITPATEGFRYRLVFRLRDGTRTEWVYDTASGMLRLRLDAATRSLFDGAPRGAPVALPTTAPIDTSVVTTAPADPSPTTLPLPGAVPDHGIAYSTAQGVVVATLDGTVVFELAGWRIADRSPDLARTAALVVGVDGSPYALAAGQSTMAPAAYPNPSNVPGWQASGTSGCLRDARRADGRLLLCSLTPAGLPRSIDQARVGGGTDTIAGAPAVAAPGSGHWADAVEGPGGAVAATWSGDCESLTSYRIAADGVPVLLVPGESAVLRWDGDAVLVARFGGCGPSSPDDGVYRIAAGGFSTRIPAPDAIEPAVAW